MDYGTVQHNGIELAIKQEPHIETVCDNYICHDCYQAIADDSDGNEYIVRWAITNPDADDEIDACNWEKYTVKEV